ncbi:MAG TPA: hypothetical protein VOA64_04640 [Candidatus Dormibacteraeota bacterium]|nr:hypothetical protein [Candidatus Dormibacteraeota bacterium]
MKAANRLGMDSRDYLSTTLAEAVLQITAPAQGKPVSPASAASSSTKHGEKVRTTPER